MENIRKYQPSNGSEGECFIDTFCFNCKFYETCDILTNTMCLHVTDDEYPTEWRYVDDKPVCTAFVAQRFDDDGNVIEPVPVNQLSLF